MNCKNCGAQLVFRNGLYVCDYCASSFTKEEFTPPKKVVASSEFSIRGGILVNYLGDKQDVVIPDGVMVIGPGAFKNNVRIKSVAFPQSVNKIDNNAFEECTNLEVISNYESIRTYGDECFRYAGLKQLSIGESVDHLGKYCFANMANLETLVYKPHKLLKHNHTFANCTKLTNVKCDQFYFFPSFHSSMEVRNNPDDHRPTFSDVFVGTPFIKIIKEKYFDSYHKGICPECGGSIRKGLFHAKCQKCGIDFKN